MIPTLEWMQWAAWFSTPWQKVGAEALIEAAYRLAEEGCLLGNIEWSELSPDDPRVPAPPERFGREARLLVGQACVLALRKPVETCGFIANLEAKDLLQLRRITRRAARRSSRSLTDGECDAIIERLGPDAALQTLRG